MGQIIAPSRRGPPTRESYRLVLLQFDREVALVEEKKPEGNDREDAVVEEVKAEEKDREVAVVEEEEKLEKDLEQSDEVKAEGWGWDQDFTAPEGNQSVEKDLGWTSEVKVEGWGWDQYFTAPEGNQSVEKDLEWTSEVKVEGWGWDQYFTAPEGNQRVEKDLEWTSEVKADGWGWDQHFTAPEGNQSVEKDLEWTSGEKVDGWGWNQETGGSKENAKGEKGSESWKDEKGQWWRSPFPQRPSKPDCSFFVKTGTCRYELNCKFNHPPSRMRNNKMKFRKLPESAQAVELNGNGASSEMVGQTQRENAYKERKMGTPSASNVQMDCKYHTMPGGCKYGSACKYNHKEKIEVPVKLNFLGLPMRPGEKECTYYMSTGSCKYSTNCRFHHPDPIAVGGQDTSSGYQNGGSSQPCAPLAQLPMTSWPVQRTPTEPVPFLDTSSPYVTEYFLPPQGLHPNPEWNGYQAPPPVNPLFPAEMNMPHPSVATMKDTVCKGNDSAPRTAPDGEYPERPGQAECSFFMKTGTCKFKSACKFHHPKSRLPKTSGVDVSSVGLPLRPDQPVCTHYSRHGICKYGRSCRYNHL